MICRGRGHSSVGFHSDVGNLWSCPPQTHSGFFKSNNILLLWGFPDWFIAMRGGPKAGGQGTAVWQGDVVCLFWKRAMLSGPARPCARVSSKKHQAVQQLAKVASGVVHGWREEWLTSADTIQPWCWKWNWCWGKVPSWQAWHGNRPVSDSNPPWTQ